MRLAVLSDIHGNLIALETVLADLEASGGADLIWCLGDISAGASRPAECVRKIRAMSEVEVTEGEGDEAKTKITESKTFKVIGGNTDRYLVTGERMPAPSAKDEAGFAKLANAWQTRDRVFNWSLGQLSWEDYQYLKKLRQREVAHEVEGYGWVIGFHAVPGNDETIMTADTPDEEAADYLLDREGRLAIYGHIHSHVNRFARGWHIVNVGSVGMSFEFPGVAQYGIFTFENGEVSVDLRNIPYDLDALRVDFEESGHPAPDRFLSRILQPQPLVLPNVEADHAETH